LSDRGGPIREIGVESFKPGKGKGGRGVRKGVEKYGLKKKKKKKKNQKGPLIVK